MQIEVNNRELKEFDYFKYLGNVLTRDGYCTKKIKMRIVTAKEAFNRKISLSIASYGSEIWALRKLGRKYWESFEIWCWRRMEKIRRPEKVTIEKVLERIGEKRTLLNNILRRKANLIDHILKRNCLLHAALEVEMTKVKGVGRRRTPAP